MMEFLTDVEKAIRVWSFDSGGRSVLYQLLIVDRIMRLIQWKKRLDRTPLPYEHADVMIGTGLGGVAAILMGRLDLSASEAYEEIVQLGQGVFRKPISTRPYFNLDTLRSTIRQILERRGYQPDAMMIEDGSLTGRCHVVVLASSKFDTPGYKSIRTYPSPTSANYAIVDAIAATMAAPDWFEPATVGSGHEKQTLISVSIGHSNPTWEGLLEAKQLFGIDARVTSVISIGSTGMDSPPTTLNPRTLDDSTKWISQVLSDCGQIARRLSGYFSNVSAYVRITADSVIEDANISNWEENVIEPASYLDRVEIGKLCDQAVENLLQKAGSISLGQLTQATATKVGARAVPRLTPYYIARPEIHERMKECLDEEDPRSQKAIVIHGMAGSGKTQSASYFAHTHRKRYSHVFFIDASSVASIKSDLQSAVRSLGGSHSQDTYEDAIDYLQSTEIGQFLVIFDNADDPKLPLIEFIPSSNHGHIIITTRNPDLAILFPTSHLNIPPMDVAEALSVLFLASQSRRAEDQADQQQAVEICRLVGCLPLALVQVGCFCYSSKATFSHYLDRFKEYRQRLMATRPSWQLDQYPHSAYTSISLSYSLLDETERSLFHLLTFFHHSNIQVDIFRVSARHQFTKDPDFDLAPTDEHHDRWWRDLQNIFMENGLWNQTRVDELLMRLQSLSLVTLGSSESSSFITIHPLVQSFAQDILTKEDFRRFHYMAALTISGCIWDENPDIFRHLFLHIFEVENCKAQLHVNNVAAFAYLFFIMIFENEALERWKIVQDQCEKQFGPDHRSPLYAAAQTASCLRDLGEYQSAETIFQRIIPIQERILEVDHRDTLSSYNRYALTLEEQGRYHDAEQLLRRKLQGVERKHGKTHKEAAVALSSLGGNLYRQGRYSEAEDTLREAIPVLKRTISEDNMLVFTSVGALAEVLIELDKWEEAEDILQRLVQTRAKIFGMEDVNTLVSIGVMSRCVRHRGDLRDAERIQRSCLDLLSKRLTDDHKYVISARSDLDKTLELLDQVNKKLGVNDSDKRVGTLEGNMVYYATIFCFIAVLALYFI